MMTVKPTDDRATRLLGYGVRGEKNAVANRADRFAGIEEVYRHLDPRPHRLVRIRCRTETAHRALSSDLCVGQISVIMPD
jgi:hypothetical protein